MATLQSLLQQMTFQQALSLVLAYYQKQGFPTSSWQEFGTDLTRAEAIATAIHDAVANQIPAIAGGSLFDYSSNYPGWTALTAHNIFNLDPNGATFTFGNITFVNASPASYPFTTANPITITFASSGKRYATTGNGTIPASGSLPLQQVRAELAGASYVDPSNSGDITIVTPSLPGVTVTNPSTPYSAVTPTGSGTGTLTLGGSPALAHSVVINITATSSINPANVSYSLDGQPAISLGAVSSITNLGGTGINITFVNGASGVSWVNGDTYQFSTPASWISSQGADAQSDLSLIDDCRNKWSDQSVVPTSSLYVYLAKRTPSVGAQVTQAFSFPDPVVNNKVNVIVSGPAGPLPASTITLIQNYLTPRARGCDRPVVQSPTTLPLAYAATITCTAAQLAAVQAAASTALLLYTAFVTINGTIKLSDIEVIIKPNPMTGVGGIAGVTDIGGITINGVASNLTLGSPTTFVLPAYPPTLNLTYVTQ